MDELTVIISGGFSLAYHNVLPAFEQASGIKVKTLSGASQGAGPKTIKYQLQHGADADVVILSREGLDELIGMGRIVAGSTTELATVPLGAAVRHGSPKPVIDDVASFTQAVLGARLVVMPASTSGLFIQNEIFPKLGISGKVSAKVMPRGTDSTAALAAGDADLALGPISELIGQPGIDLVGPLPSDVQLVQTFTAAIVDKSGRQQQASKLIEFLTSERTANAIKASGMDPVRRR